MSGLADRLVAMLGDVARPIGSFREQSEELIRRTGSVTAAARAAGVDRRTYQRWRERWRAGKEPRPRKGTPAKLAGAVQRARMAADAPADASVVLHTRDRDDPGRERTLTARQLRLAPGTMARVAETYVATGDREAAAAAFLAGVGDQWYRRYLTPPAAQRDRTGPDLPDAGEGPARRAPAGAGDEDEDEEEEIEDLDDWDAYYDDLIAEHEVEEYDEGYGGDVA